MATIGDVEIANLTGQNVTKVPGSINGETVALKHLTDCTIYILDFSSEVEVTNCTSCQIFIGPIDGPAIFDGCVACNITVACQQFQAKNCRDVDFGLYVSTQPTLKDSTEIRVACWMGAYPGLTSHFTTTNLDPMHNQWNKMNDLSSEMGLLTNFELVDQPEYWEVPLEGAGPPDNPIPNAEGAMYSGGGSGVTTAGSGLATGATPRGVAADESLFSMAPTSNGNADVGLGGSADFGQQDGLMGMDMGTGAAAPSTPGVNPKVAAMQKEMRERLARQEEIEQKTKAEMNGKAKTYLTSFYEKRKTSTTKKHEINRQEESNPIAQGPQGTSGWEKTVNMIDFGFTRPNGADLARYKSILFTAKAKNMPVGSKPGASGSGPVPVVSL